MSTPDADSALIIPFGVQVLASVRLNSEAGGDTAEVHDIPGNRHLAAEVISVQLAAAQQ